MSNPNLLDHNPRGYGKRRIKDALARVGQEIKDIAGCPGDRYAGAVAGEGYAGGYAAALQDVLLLLNKVEPCVRPNYWRIE